MRIVGRALLLLGVVIGLLVPIGMAVLPTATGLAWLARVGLAKLVLLGSLASMTLGALALRRARVGASALSLVTAFVLPVSASAQQPPQMPAINAGLPAVSPNGAHVAFVSTRDGIWDVYVAASDGSNVRRITRDTLPEGDLQWLGDEVVFSVTSGPRTAVVSTLYAVRVDGSGRREVGSAEGRGVRLAANGRSILTTRMTPPNAPLLETDLQGRVLRTLSDTVGIFFEGAQSPDGRRVAYTRMTPTFAMTIWVANADGTSARMVFDAGAGRGAQWPRWSPDGTRLAVQVVTRSAAQQRPTVGRIWVIDVAGGSPPKELQSDAPPSLDETPSWFPDGRIAFQSNRTGRTELWVMGADGSAPRQVTR